MHSQFQKFFYRPLPHYLPIVLHVTIWLLYVTFVIYINNYQGVNFIIGHPGIHLFAEITIFYANYNYLIPALLAHMRIPRFLLLNILCIIGLVATCIPTYHLIRNWYLGAAFTTFPLSYPEQFVLRSLELLMFAGLACIIRFAVDWFAFQQKRREMENTQLKTELALLRSQLNPHFLFNTLNSLYALAIKQAPGTPDGIMQLSQLMRYVLYETNEDRVSLVREVEMIENFLELQKLRLPLDFPLHFEIQGNINDIALEPLLLMPIVENIFKHGAGFASISLNVTTNTLTLHTSNEKKTSGTETKGGIGLSNLRKRLSHLYPANHQLLCQENTETFQTTLSLTF